MNKYIEQLLKLYKEKKIEHDIALSLLESYKAFGDKTTSDNRIAIVGMECRMPMANSKEEFWERLQSGTNCVGSFPLERRLDTDPLIPILAHNLHSTDKPYWQGGFLSSVDGFDHRFFHILPGEAKIMDPQQRIFLEVAHAAFEDAGYCISKLRGSNTGVFIGDVVNEYQKIVTEVSPLAVIGNVSPFIASRVSYFYDLHGPTINVSTTCSTSLVAVHLACQSLTTGESDLVLVGAVNLRLFPFGFMDDPVDALGITTPDGACHAFDNRANGIVRGEGVGALVLKRYKDAIKDRNHIYGVIRGSHVNNDGRSSNVGAPNPLAHAALLKKTWEKSSIDPRQISYIEAHGTGTHIGDPIEVQGIGTAFSAFTHSKQFCGIGSVKTNIGHLTGGAAGLAGLIKTVLALHHEQIPPSLHFESPNEFIDFPNTPLFVVDHLTPWPRELNPRIAGISAFGFNGTNCHVIVEEAPELKREAKLLKKVLPFLFTHQTESGLQAQIKKYLDFFEKNQGKLNPEDISFTLALGRDHYSFQLLLFAISIEDLNRQLSSFLAKKGPVISTDNNLNWEEIFNSLEPHFISLPTYIFESQRFWLEGEVWRNNDQIVKNSILSSEKEIEIPLENQLVNLFQEVMGLEKVQPTDSFFDLGGDSLLGIEVITLIHKRLKKKISYNDFFKNPRIHDLAQLLSMKETTLFQSISQAPIQELYPLSYGQRRLWILNQMQDHPIAYNICDAYQFDSPIDPVRLQMALDHLVERHDAFRITFIEKEGIPYQKIASHSTFNLRVLNVSSLEVAYQEIDALKQEPFDLENGPLAKAILLPLSSTTSLFFFMMHHIISDGWSIRIIIEEILKLYRGISLSPLRVNLIDYSYSQQHQLMTEKRFEELRSFWFDRLTAPLAICEIPGDKVRPAVFSFQGARKTFDISKQCEEKLSFHGRKENATLFMVLLASIYVLIYRYTGQTDLIIGSPISGRFHADLKPLIGFFVNTLALRCSLNPLQTFALFLEQVKNQTLHDFENQDYPFDLLIDQLKLERDTSRSPLFNINVAFQNFELSKEAKEILIELKTKRIELPHDSCKWDIEFEFVKQQDGSIICFVEYYTGVYSEEMISTIILAYQTLLQSLEEGFQTPISHIALSPLSRNISGPLVSYPHIPLHELFEQQVARIPDIVAVKAFDQMFSYKELNEKANQLAHFLKWEKNLKLEECVGLYLENSFEVILSILGILKAGGAYVPLDIKSPLDRIRLIISEAKIGCILSVKKHLKALGDLQWSTELHSFVCLDSMHIDREIEEVGTNFMDVALWDQVAHEGQDEIVSSGWVSSFTGLPFSLEEMEEYKGNVLKKLQPYLYSDCRILEIGCGSGLTAFTIAPHVGFYLGVDISSAILKKNSARAEQGAFSNLQFAPLAAHEIDTLTERDFDIIIINSVIHCFPGHNYFKNILKKAVNLSRDKGVIFLGDLMDLDLKNQLEASLCHFKNTHRNEQFRTKLDWSQELFISRDFLSDLRSDLAAIADVTCGHKYGSIKNELTEFRFDAILTIDKACTVVVSPKKKQQYDYRNLEVYGIQNLEVPISDRSLAYILFTSGSTGLPKGVMVEHRSVHNYINWAIHYYGMTYFKFPFYSSLHFDLTVTSIFTPLLSGGYIRIFRGEIDEILEHLAHADDCNILKLTPTHLTILSEKNLPSSHIRQFIIGGETLHASQAVQISRLFDQPISIYNEYGPTEATVGCIAYQWNPIEKEGTILIGTPINNCKIHIVDEYFQPVPVGGIGEIIIEGDCLARGYLNQSELTEQKFRRDLSLGARIYCTGDLGRYLPNQKIAYAGRKDRQIKIRGYRVELDEIESRFLQHPSIQSCIVILKNHFEYGKILCGYYVATTSLPLEEIQHFLSQRLPSYMIPPFLISLEAMPTTKNGKIDVSRLPDPGMRRTKHIISPQSNIETLLHKIWSRVLNVTESELSTEDDFFDLGGDSIIAMRILPQVKSLGLTLSIKEIFQYRTIKMLSQKINRPISPPISEEQMRGSFSLAPIQRWFWDQKMVCPGYFTMAYLFDISINLQIERLEECFWKCFEHHDTFRSIFKGDYQEILPLSDLQFQIEEFGLEKLDEEDQKEEILRITAVIQNSFDITQAPLVKAAVFNLGNRGKRFFLTIHHLIIDGVSWRYLIEDLSALYYFSLQKPLPTKTHSYKKWVQTLQEFPILERNELGMWLDIDPPSFTKIFKSPCPFMEDTVETFIHFSKEETITLISNMQSFYTANINEILLAALTLSISEIFGIEKLLIHHEGHGRNGVEDLDISRTIGWFTTIYPLLLEKQVDLISTLIKVKENMQIFGQNDLFYCVARYLQNNTHLKKFNPEILFNYFGRVDADLFSQGGQQIFGNSHETISSTSHSKNKMSHLIEINSIILDDQLRISIVYSPNSVKEENFQSWLDSFKKHIIAYILEKERISCSSDHYRI